MLIADLNHSLNAYAPSVALQPRTERGTAGNGGAKDTLTPEQSSELQKLKARDRAVRAHEQAHLAAAGGLATSGASFTYQRGPDGVNYAVGGEVDIDTSTGRTPEETLRRAETIRAAALAPADPSPQDRAVAAAASKMALDAQTELARQPTENPSSPDAELSRRYQAADNAPGGLLDAYA